MAVMVNTIHRTGNEHLLGERFIGVYNIALSRVKISEKLYVSSLYHLHITEQLTKPRVQLP